VLASLLSCLALAALGLALATHDLTGELTTRGACRDLAGFAGLALIGAAFLGANWFWTLPVVAAMVPMIGLRGDGLIGLLTWPLRSDQSSSANAIAVTLLLAGFLSLALTRPR
jgi:pimeloyl-ACP methyl ester carboxylesterase